MVGPKQVLAGAERSSTRDNPAIVPMPGAHVSGTPRNIVLFCTRWVGCRSAQPVRQGVYLRRRGSYLRERGWWALPGESWTPSPRRLVGQDPLLPSGPCLPCGAPRWEVCLGEWGFELRQPDFNGNRGIPGTAAALERLPGGKCFSSSIARAVPCRHLRRVWWLMRLRDS